MSLSEYFEDSDVVSQLRGFFGLDEQWTIDFYSALSTVEDYDDEHFMVKVKSRKFLIHKIHGGVNEVA